MKSVTVRVPATSANLGPGFDCLGCAFALYNTFTFTVTESGLSFENVEEEFCNAENLAISSLRYTARRLGLPETGIHLRIDTGIPICRGLGSSASLIVAGVMAAGLLADAPLSREQVLRFATELEGHPDNVAPAIWGNMTAAMLSDTVPVAVKYNVSRAIHFLSLTPDFKLSTKLARSVLPESISRADAVFNVSHTAVLVRAMELGDAELIHHALRDRLHQPYRETLIHDYHAMETLALDAGACGFCISGAGPTCMALTTSPDTAERLAASLAAASGKLQSHWSLLPLPVDHEGAVWE